MYCRYCECYVKSTRRIETKEESKRAPARRLCDIKKEWVEPDREMCDDMQASNSFWCDKLNQCQDIDSCRNRVAKKISRHCRPNCSQYQELTDVIRMRRRKK